MIRTTAISTAILSLSLTAAASGQSATLFRDARVFDGTRVQASMDVLVRDGRIAALGANVNAPTGATVIEAAGMTLLPGLIDAQGSAFTLWLPLDQPRAPGDSRPAARGEERA